ncbi:PAS domain-containing protein [Paramaledivibacter caminithermalis]|jgi:diguanylate cyclase|uniref:PAS domain S-box-containing protein n=1 Tax=Paramaledivibacter caminithermalis (strain DSM 15212 / CIP 107654 / DViRD3) TaxID=1121301 RepID=A0A1M6NCM5_PARC5|nr:PAS domain-containing protein [Paramaledivibacter caminithermalis]SHJ93495.1 PAS domain S-box-containing protein [Paramaledivibacter caminithermalis DSM 15212]
MLHSFFDNVFLVVGALFIGLKLRDYTSKKTSIHRFNIWIFSIYASLTSILSMFNSYMNEELFFDIRSIPLFFISYVYGWKAGLISCILPSLFRYYIGGAMVWQGIILSIVIPIIVGALFYKSKVFDNQYRFFSIKSTLLVYSVYCIIRAVIIWFVVPVSNSSWLKNNMSTTIISLMILCFIVFVINDSNKNMLLKIEMDNKQRKIEDLNSKLLNSNDTLISLLDAMPVGIVVFDTKGNIILNNATSANILGTIANKIGGRFTDSNKRAYYLHRLDGSEIPLKELPYWQTIEKGRVIKDAEILLRRKDKKEKIILVSSTPIYDDKDNIANGVVVFQDITHLKIIENTLRQSRKIGEAFINGITEVLILIDREGTIFSLNETGSRELGLKVSEAIGLNIFDFISPELKEKIKKKLNEFIKSKSYIAFEQELGERYFNITLYPIFNNYGIAEKFVIFSKDITKLKEAEEIKN